MSDQTIPAWASAIALVIHALASAAVQVIRAWKQPVTISGPRASSNSAASTASAADPSKTNPPGK